jgi:hypothetical protein
MHLCSVLCRLVSMQQCCRLAALASWQLITCLNGWKMTAVFPRGMPMPVSSTLMAMVLETSSRWAVTRM